MTACVESSSVPPGESHSIQFDWPARGVPQLDLLFVVDDTPAMAPYRERILELGPLTASSLRGYSGGMPDVHIAVATETTLSTISDVHNNDGSRTTSYRGVLDDVLASMLDVGAASSSPSQPLATIERALSRTDFVRPDTNFMTVTISANDDHSLDSVDHYVDAVKSRTQNSVAAGVFPAQSPRLEHFHEAFDPFHAGFVTTLDDSDWSVVMEPTNSIVDFLYPCFYDERPVEPYECSISMIENDVETVLPPCSSTPEGACWQIVPDPSCVGDRGIGTTIDVRGYARPYRPHLVGQCVTH
ncbi:MAG TPA: hypothetical protein VMZ53_34395 [Kofleriaceae bacterium]|nr:hypothetical protein [Kofleriaceae bacterium]